MTKWGMLLEYVADVFGQFRQKSKGVFSKVISNFTEWCHSPANALTSNVGVNNCKVPYVIIFKVVTLISAVSAFVLI